MAGCFTLSTSGATIPVAPITNNSGMSATVAAEVQIDIADAGIGLVDITVTNNGDGLSDFVITQFYIDDEIPPLFIGFDTLPANWDSPGTPANVPSGSTVSFLANHTSDADNPQPTNGIDIGESATFRMSLDTGVSTQDVIDAMFAETTRIGLHIQSIGPGGESDSFVTTPEPGSLALLGVAGAMVLRRR